MYSDQVHVLRGKREDLGKVKAQVLFDHPNSSCFACLQWSAFFSFLFYLLVVLSVSVRL